MPHPKTHSNMLHDRLKQNQTQKKPVNLIWNCIYLLGIWYLQRRKCSRPFISAYPWIQSKDGKYLGKKFHEIPKIKTWICHSSSTIYIALTLYLGFPGGLDSKESACSVGDMGSIPGLRRSPGEGNGNPLQYCYLENSMDRGAWWAPVHGVAKSRTWLSD